MALRLLNELHLKFLSLIGARGYTGSSESALVKMPHCWKSHVDSMSRARVDSGKGCESMLNV